jgi:hypothetical protein
LNNIGTISCTTWTTQGTFNFTSGTGTSNKFRINKWFIYLHVRSAISSVPFTHTAGTVTLNKAYSLTTTGTYTLVAGTLTLNANLTTGSFITTGTVTVL